MECTKCGRPIGDGAVFCSFCGEKIVPTHQAGQVPIYTADVKGLLKSGKLAVYHDRVEFITSNIQKTVYNYSGLISVKKGLNRIAFVTGDGRTESCTVNKEVLHDAFFHIEKASRPYIEERKQRLLAQGIQYSFVSSMGLTSGILNILDDRAEFTSKSGQNETVLFKDAKSVSVSLGILEFSLLGERTRTFTLDKELRDQVFDFVEKAVASCGAKRKEALLAKGIYHSFPSSQGDTRGTMNIFEDRAEYITDMRPDDITFFRDVRAAQLFMGMLELSLTDGTAKSFSVEADMQNQVLSFIEDAIRPYVLDRTAGFDTAFGTDQQIEINEARGIFHILRQDGREISDPYPLSAIVRCDWEESDAPDTMLSGVLSMGMSILNGAAASGGPQSTSDTEPKIAHTGLSLTLRTEEGPRTEHIQFGIFSLGTSRTGKKYIKCIDEIERFMEYLRRSCPECALTPPDLPAPVPAQVSAPVSAPAPAQTPQTPAASDTAPDSKLSQAEDHPDSDRFGITRYIEGVTQFISECTAPMTIAIQGTWDSGKNSIMELLSQNLKKSYPENVIAFNARQFSQPDSEKSLPMLAGRRLITQLGGGSSTPAKDRMVKVAKGLINITSGFISQGSTDGQNITDALFSDSSGDSLENLVTSFSNLVKKRIGEGAGKVIIRVDNLDSLTPAKGLELLEAIQNFADCEGCVFVIAVNHDFIARGAREKYGPAFNDRQIKNLFNTLFQISFRVPASGYDIHNYVKDKLEHIEIPAGSEAELESYVGLIRCSVGCEPQNMDRLFNSFLLLKKMAHNNLYENKDRRLMLFALLCIQTKFHDIYELMVRMKDKITPDFLSDLCGGRLQILERSDWTDDEKAEFRDFAQVFQDVISTDGDRNISVPECRVFGEVLDFSSITSK